MTIPIFIICRDRLTCTVNLINWFEKCGYGERIYLIDNDSIYEPLIDFYNTTSHHVIKTGHNYHHLAPWTLGIVESYAKNEYYIVSDPDVLPIDDCPLDAIEYWKLLLHKYPDRTKAGPNLKIDDIPDHYALKQAVINHESIFLNYFSPSEGVIFAPIDTTLAIYAPNAGQDISYSIRTQYPYVARHSPWYIDSKNLPEEEKFYRSRLNSEISNWNRD